jgi:hypothetical protein
MQKGGVAVVDGDAAERNKWADVVDRWIGTESRSGDPVEALRLARKCQHKDAQWLRSLLPEREEGWTERQIEAAFSSHTNEPRSLFFFYALWEFPSERMNECRLAAVAGYPPAQVHYGKRAPMPDEERFEWFRKASEAGDRSGTLEMAGCLLRAKGCTRDVAGGVALLRRAAEAGHIEAMYSYGSCGFTENDPERYEWYCRAAALGDRDALDELHEAAALADPGACMFEMGRGCKRHLDVAQGTLFAVQLDEDSLEDIQKVIAYYDECVQRAKRAVDCWSLVGARLGVVKDVRIVVARLIWEDLWKRRGSVARK